MFSFKNIIFVSQLSSYTYNFINLFCDKYYKLRKNILKIIN